MIAGPDRDLTFATFAGGIDRSIGVTPRPSRIRRSRRIQAVHDIGGAPSGFDEHGFRRAEPFIGMEHALFPDMG